MPKKPAVEIVPCDQINCFANRTDEEEHKGFCQILTQALSPDKQGLNCPFRKTKEFKKSQELMLYGESEEDQKSYMLG